MNESSYCTFNDKTVLITCKCGLSQFEKGWGGDLSLRNTMKRSEKFKIKYNLKKNSRAANDLIGKGRKG